MLNPLACKRWINALLNGGYKQTTGELRDCRGYCLLGVAADSYMAVMLPQSIPPAWEPLPNHPHGAFSWGGKSGYLAFVGMYHYGLSDDLQQALSVLNDAGATFHDLAALIQRMLDNPSLEQAVSNEYKRVSAQPKPRDYSTLCILSNLDKLNHQQESM